MSLCTTCSSLNITAILRNGVLQSEMIPLGSLVDIIHKADQCRFCNLIAVLFRRCWCLDAFPHVDLTGVDCALFATDVGALANPHLEDRKRCHRLEINFSTRPVDITDALMKARMDLLPQIQLLEEDAHKVLRAKEVHGRRVSATFDMKQAKHWLSLCEQAHGDACESIWWRGKDVLPHFVRVIDVIQMSLIQAPPNCRFVALSYVWGTAGNNYWTTTANLELRAQSGGIDVSVLPATIMDSIHVTRALGESYLWVDALCITQDSLDDKEKQIRCMELIYSKALLTIVAAGGEGAHARLPGVLAESRTLHQHIETIEDLHLAIPLPSLIHAITQSTWGTRGWTYQELLISRRRLFFTEHQVYFECAKDVWCEDLVAESKTVEYSRHPMRYRRSDTALFLPIPLASWDRDYMSSYITVVTRYTQCRLTYPSDVLDAITALTNAMTKGYRLAQGDPAKAFRYGMQIRNLEFSLLWQPRLDSTLARRVNDTGLPMFPSWAWAGWIGAVVYSSLDQFVNTRVIDTRLAQPTEFLVKGWYLIDDNRQFVQLDVERIRIVQWDLERAPSSRYRASDTDEIDRQLLPDPLPPVGTLVFRTQRASFRVSKLETTSDGTELFPYTVFRILSDVRQPGVDAGRMILTSTTPSLSVLECIVLSRDNARRGLYDVKVYGDSYLGCMLHVMAVKVGEDTQVRQRVGLGIIHEQAWLECKAQVETVFLG